MKAFLKGFGWAFAVVALLFLIMPIVMGEPYGRVFGMFTDAKAGLGILWLVFVFGLIMSFVFALIDWARRKNKQNDEVNELMRQYLEKKMKEDAEKGL